MVTSVVFVATFAAAGGADSIVFFLPAALKSGCAAVLWAASMLSGIKSAGFVASPSGGDCLSLIFGGNSGDSGFPSGSCSIVVESSGAGGPFALLAGAGFSGKFFPGNLGKLHAHPVRVAAASPSGSTRCTLRCLRPSVGAISPKAIPSQEWPGLSGQHALDPSLVPHAAAPSGAQRGYQLRSAFRSSMAVAG
jgi:hypothetical protein